MGAPTPTAEGNLKRTPFGHVLLHIQHRQMSGTLAVWPDPGKADDAKGQDRILFSAGQPVRARLLQPASSLDRGLLSLFHRAQAPYAFYEADLVGNDEGVLTGQVALLQLLTASLRGGARDDVIEKILGKLGSDAVRLRPGVDLGAYDFNAKEQGFVDVIRADPAGPQQLLNVAGDERRAKRLLYLLTITHAIEVPESTDSQPPSALSSPPMAPSSGAPPVKTAVFGAPTDSTRSTAPSAAPGPAKTPTAEGDSNPLPDPPAHLSPEHSTRWAEIAARVDTIENEDYFTMLEIEHKASHTDVRDAFFRLAKIWHPDRLPTELGPLKKYVDRIFGYLNDANEILTHDERRGRYMQVLQEGGGTPAADKQIHDIVHAATLFQKAEVLVKHRQWDEAMEKLNEAMELNADEPDVYAVQAWVMFHQHPDENGPLQEMLGRLDRAISMNERSERAHFYKATILKKHGRHAEATKYFARTAEINPRNIEAAREVRLADMRGRDGEPATEQSGFLSKLFGSKKKDE